MYQLTLYNGFSRVAARREPRPTGPSDGFGAKLPLSPIFGLFPRRG